MITIALISLIIICFTILAGITLWGCIKNETWIFDANFSYYGNKIDKLEDELHELKNNLKTKE